MGAATPAVPCASLGVDEGAATQRCLHQLPANLACRSVCIRCPPTSLTRQQALPGHAHADTFQDCLYQCARNTDCVAWMYYINADSNCQDGLDFVPSQFDPDVIGCPEKVGAVLCGAVRCGVAAAALGPAPRPRQDICRQSCEGPQEEAAAPCARNTQFCRDGQAIT